MITLGQLKSSTIPRSVGLAACSADFLQLANEAQTRITSEGRWWGTTKRLRVCVTQKCITWPSGVATVEGFNIAGVGVPLRNGWFEFQDNVRNVEIGSCDCFPQQLLDRGLTPQYRDTTANSYIRIYPVTSQDDGAEVLLQGLDQNGNPIRQTDGTEWYDGEKVTIASPFVDTVTIFQNPGLTGAQKPITKSYLKVFSVNSVTGEETQIATWGPSETAPLYRRSALVHLPIECGYTDTGNGCAPGLVNCTNAIADAIVRIEPVTMVVDTDWCAISNLAAMKAAMKALQKEDKNDYAGATREYQEAIRLLRADLAKYDPPERIQINSQIGILGRPLKGWVF